MSNLGRSIMHVLRSACSDRVFGDPWPRSKLLRSVGLVGRSQPFRDLGASETQLLRPFPHSKIVQHPTRCHTPPWWRVKAGGLRGWWLFVQFVRSARTQPKGQRSPFGCEEILIERRSFVRSKALNPLRFLKNV